MERKLVVQGKQTYTVALPIEWVRKHNLENKDSIQINEQNNQLIISTERQAPYEIAELDVRNNSRLQTMLQIEAKYIQGNDEIRIMHNNLPHIRETSQSLSGMIIEDYEESKCTLKSIVTTANEDVRKIILKTTHILNQQAKSLVRLAKKEINLDTALAEEFIIDQNNLYAIRYLNKYQQNKDGHALFLICSTFDIISDLMGEIAKNIGEDITIAERIQYFVEQYTTLLQKNKFKKLNDVLLDETKQEKNTFLDGLLYSLTELMYNYLAYIVEAYNT